MKLKLNQIRYSGVEISTALFRGGVTATPRGGDPRFRTTVLDNMTQAVGQKDRKETDHRSDDRAK